MYSILLEKFSNSNISKKLSDSNISKISPTSFNIRWTPIRIKIFASIVSKTFRWMFKYAIFSPSLGCCFQITIPFLLTKRKDIINKSRQNFKNRMVESWFFPAILLFSKTFNTDQFSQITTRRHLLNLVWYLPCSQSWSVAIMRVENLSTFRIGNLWSLATGTNNLS